MYMISFRLFSQLFTWWNDCFQIICSSSKILFHHIFTFTNLLNHPRWRQTVQNIEKELQDNRYWSVQILLYIRHRRNDTDKKYVLELNSSRNLTWVLEMCKLNFNTLKNLKQIIVHIIVIYRWLSQFFKTYITCSS